jgi:urease accessory protein
MEVTLAICEPAWCAALADCLLLGKAGFRSEDVGAKWLPAIHLANRFLRKLDHSKTPTSRRFIGMRYSLDIGTDFADEISALIVSLQTGAIKCMLAETFVKPKIKGNPMKLLSRKLICSVGIGTLAMSAGLAQAHTGHGVSGFTEGLAHPVGMDHLLAMVAVGIWSVSALPANKSWWGPVVFMLSLLASAALGAMGLTVPFLEHMISLSVVLFGAMLIFNRQKTSMVFGLGVVALAAALHGLAHGAETPAGGFAGYAAGFLLTTAALHFGGVSLALNIRRYLDSKAGAITTGLGVMFGGAGLYLVSQL